LNTYQQVIDDYNNKCQSYDEKINGFLIQIQQITSSKEYLENDLNNKENIINDQNNTITKLNSKQNEDKI